MTLQSDGKIGVVKEQSLRLSLSLMGNFNVYSFDLDTHLMSRNTRLLRQYNDLGDFDIQITLYSFDLQTHEANRIFQPL